MAYRRITIVAGSAQELEQKAAAKNAVLPPGSSGRIEVVGRRSYGVCTAPIGAALATPLIGQQFAQRLAPAGVVITKRGGLGGWGPDCDGYLEFEVPAPMGQDAVMRAFPVVAIVVVLGAVAATIALLGWAVREIRATIDVVAEAAGPVFPLVAAGGAVLLLGLGVMLLRGRAG